jgi:hypothetical protein
MRPASGDNIVMPRHRVASAGLALPLLVAACTALPSLFIPFLSDDWANLAATSGSLFGRTPYGYFRPLTQATFLVERAAWGVWPLPYHLTNLGLVVGATALVFLLIRRHSGDPILATFAGTLFAVHPYHIENVAWVSGRTDVLSAILLLGAALAYDRWRMSPRGVPVGALLLFEASLAAKETGIVLPAVLLVLSWLRDDRRPGTGEWLRGLLPMAAVGLVHFLWLRPMALGHSGLGALGRFGWTSVVNMLGFGAAAVLPARAEILKSDPKTWGFAAGLAAGLLIAMAWKRARSIPRAACFALALFLVLVTPALLSFEEHYFFLPSAASSLALAATLRAMGRRAGTPAAVLLAVAWSVFATDQWVGWREAGRASDRLIAGLVEASRDPGVERIVVANLPRRVRGVPVGIEYDAAVVASGGEKVTVEYLAYLDYPDASADFLDGAAPEAIRRTASGAEIDLRVPQGRDAAYVHPPPGEPGRPLETEHGSIVFTAGDRVRLTIPRPATPETAVCVWHGGRLESLFDAR